MGWAHTAGPADTVTVLAGGTATLQLGAFQDLTLSGTAFADLNGNGVQDPNEARLSGWTIQLYTDRNGQLSTAPIQTTTTDALGGYTFSNLGPLAAGASYVLAEVLPTGWVQTSPSSTSAGSTLLPDGNHGYLVEAVGGVALTTAAGNALIGGTGTATLNALNNVTIATISYDDGAGGAGSVEVYVSQFAVTYTDNTGASDSFNTFCIDLTHDVTVGQATGAYTQGDLSSGFVTPPGWRTFIRLRHEFERETCSGGGGRLGLSLNSNPTSFSLDATAPTAVTVRSNVVLTSGAPSRIRRSLVNLYWDSRSAAGCRPVGSMPPRRAASTYRA